MSKLNCERKDKIIKSKSLVPVIPDIILFKSK